MTPRQKQRNEELKKKREQEQLRLAEEEKAQQLQRLENIKLMLLQLDAKIQEKR